MTENLRTRYVLEIEVTLILLRNWEFFVYGIYLFFCKAKHINQVPYFKFLNFEVEIANVFKLFLLANIETKF